MLCNLHQHTILLLCLVWPTYLIWIVHSSAFNRNPTVSCWCWRFALIGSGVCGADGLLPYLAMRKPLCTGRAAGRKPGGDQNRSEPIGVEPYLTGRVWARPLLPCESFFYFFLPVEHGHMNICLYVHINYLMVYIVFSSFSSVFI